MEEKCRKIPIQPETGVVTAANKRVPGQAKKRTEKTTGGNGKWCGESISSTNMHRDTGK